MLGVLEFVLTLLLLVGLVAATMALLELISKQSGEVVDDIGYVRFY
jgi:uncharacterized membrane protein YkgB